MFGSGDMYLADMSPESSTLPQSDNGVDYATKNQNPMLDFDAPQTYNSSNQYQPSQNSNSVRNIRSEIVREEVKYVDKPQRKIMEIRVFYDDQTFDTFVPTKK